MNRRFVSVRNSCTKKIVVGSGRSHFFLKKKKNIEANEDKNGKSELT